MDGSTETATQLIVTRRTLMQGAAISAAAFMPKELLGMAAPAEENAATFTVLENEWITLKDGIRLAARIWLPNVAAKFPAPTVFEFLPYRKRNGTSQRDEETYSAFAAAGIAGVRVDIRGTGDSEGVIDGEYTPLELANAIEVIEWIASQPWCNGNVGMMGISWGGFNAFQVANLRPPALKAVISLSSTVDRYNDDIHYKNGVHLSAQLSWAATMLAYQSRAPDPELVGGRWRDMWMQRLEQAPFFMADWLAHQRRDEFWRHGSICESYANFPVPAMVIAGWADGYRNTPIKAIEGMPDKVTALIGPWVHAYPHSAFPAPRADFIGEAITWWNHWLREEPKGPVPLPKFRAYILDGPRPARFRLQDPGYWISKQRWEEPEFLHLTVNGHDELIEGSRSTAKRRALLKSPLDIGIAAGDWWATFPGPQLAGDQRLDNGGSLVLTSPDLKKERLLLGMPELRVKLSSDSPGANMAVRLIDVHPDGTETRISYGVLNLTHRAGDAEPTALIPGHDEIIDMKLDACGYRVAPGHRIRVALSTAYWPIMLPPPYNATLNIDLSSLSVALPLLGEHERITVHGPKPSPHLPAYKTLRASNAKYTVERDIMTGQTTFRKMLDAGQFEHPGNGMVQSARGEEKWVIVADNPLSASAECRWTTVISRPGWETATESVTTMSCSKTEWIIAESIRALYNGKEVFVRERNANIPRNLM